MLEIYLYSMMWRSQSSSSPIAASFMSFLVARVIELVESDLSIKIFEIIYPTSWLKGENHCAKIERVLKVHNMQNLWFKGEICAQIYMKNVEWFLRFLGWLYIDFGKVKDVDFIAVPFIKFVNETIIPLSRKTKKLNLEDSQRYLAPEYASTRILTEKSDVYSIGIMLLELITGKLPVDINCYGHTNIAGWAKPKLRKALENGNYDELVDPKLQNDYNRMEMTRMIFCAAACARDTAKHRPRMSQVVGVLEGIIEPRDLWDGSYSSVKENDNDVATWSVSMQISDYTQRI